MNRVRVLIANEPRMMRDLVAAIISDQPDIEIAAEIGEEGDIASTVGQIRPDVLIVSLERSGVRPSICESVLDRYPEMRVLALAPEINRGILYQRSPDIRFTQIESSEEAILAVLRGKLRGVDAGGSRHLC